MVWEEGRVRECCKEVEKEEAIKERGREILGKCQILKEVAWRKFEVWVEDLMLENNGNTFSFMSYHKEYDRMKRYLLVDYIEIKEIQINIMISDY